MNQNKQLQCYGYFGRTYFQHGLIEGKNIATFCIGIAGLCIARLTFESGFLVNIFQEIPLLDLIFAVAIFTMPCMILAGVLGFVDDMSLACGLCRTDIFGHFALDVQNDRIQICCTTNAQDDTYANNTAQITYNMTDIISVRGITEKVYDHVAVVIHGRPAEITGENQAMLKQIIRHRKLWVWVKTEEANKIFEILQREDCHAKN